MKNKLLKIGIAVSPILFLATGLVSQVRADNPYGWSPQVDFSNQGPPVCTSQKPKAPVLYQPNHPLLAKAKGKGQIRLQWTKVPDATGYNIFYGLTPKNYIYSVPSLPNTDNYTVSFLANKKYYFAVSANAGCAGSSLSNEWWGRPGGGGYAVLGSATYSPVVKKPKTVVSNTAPTINTVIPSPAVKGEATGPSTNIGNPVQENTYQAPQNNTYQPPPVAVPVAPKPKGFLQTILAILFGK